MKKLFLLILITASTVFGFGETLILNEQIKIDRIEMTGLREVQDKQCEYMMKIGMRQAQKVVANNAPFPIMKK